MLESLFNKVAGLKETSTQVLSCEYYENFKNTFFTEHLRATASDNGKPGHVWCKVNSKFCATDTCYQVKQTLHAFVKEFT